MQIIARNEISNAKLGNAPHFCTNYCTVTPFSLLFWSVKQIQMLDMVIRMCVPSYINSYKQTYRHRHVP